MMGAWLTGFIVGVLGARAQGCLELVQGLNALPLVAIVLLGALLLGLAQAPPERHRQVNGIVFVLACVWGAAHAAPSPRAPLFSARVVATYSPDPEVSGPLLVAADGDVYEVRGPEARGALGQVRVERSLGLFAARRANFRVFWQASAHKPPQLIVWGEAIRHATNRRLAPLPRRVAAWLASILVGERQALPRDLKESFRRTGLYHLLAVSGLHVTFVSILLGLALRAPLQLAYGARLLGPRGWSAVAPLLYMLAAGAALAYLVVTGASASAQRAAFGFTTWQLCRTFFGAWSLPQRLKFIATLQTLVFPLGFLGAGSLLSWAAFLLILARVGRARIDREGRTRRAFELFCLQAKLALLVAAALGQVAWLGFVANLLLVPVFGLVLATALLLLPAGGVLRIVTVAIQQSFLEIVYRFASLVDLCPWLYVAPDTLPLPLRLGAAVVSAALLLNACRDLTISGYEID